MRSARIRQAGRNHILTCGKAVTAIYIVADGYERVDDENGCTVILKKASKADAPEEVRSIDS